jgi:hypothetical protein
VLSLVEVERVEEIMAEVALMEEAEVSGTSISAPLPANASIDTSSHARSWMDMTPDSAVRDTLYVAADPVLVAVPDSLNTGS